MKVKISFSVDREICEVNLPEQIEDIRRLAEDGYSCSECGAAERALTANARAPVAASISRLFSVCLLVF